MLVQTPRRAPAANRIVTRFGRRWAVDVLARPFVRLWQWFDQVGGLPGQIFFCCAVVLGILGVATWYGNKR